MITWLRHRAFGIIRKAIAIKFPSVPQLSPAALQAWLRDPDRNPPLLIDTRHPAEYHQSHLPQAIQVDPDISMTTLEAQIGKEDREVVFYCSAGYRSSKLAARWIKQGHPRTHNLEGAIFAWANLGLPMECEGAPTRSVHPFHPCFSWLILKHDPQQPKDNQDMP